MFKHLTFPFVRDVSSIQPPGSRPSSGMTLTYFEEGRTATVAVFGREWDNHRSLRINGVEEIPIDQASLEAFFLLGHFPLGYNSDAEIAMVSKWLSAALSTGPELLYNEGRFREALELADMAWEADPESKRDLDLVIEINRAQSLAQEEY